MFGTPRPLSKRVTVNSPNNSFRFLMVYLQEAHIGMYFKWLLRGKWKGGITWEIGINIYILLSIKQIPNKDLLHSTGSCTQYSVTAYMGKESKKEWIYVFVSHIHFAVCLKLIQLCKPIIPQ